MSGTLYVVSTPIGNKDDFSPRAVNILRSVNCIFCENVKKTIPLLQHFGIETKAITLYKDHSERPFDTFIQSGLAGQDFALVSDAGTPAISDPGSQIVRCFREAGIPVSPVPGPSALAAFLSVSGISGVPILFLGFLSEKKTRRSNQLEKFSDFEGAIVLFESVHRIVSTLEIIAELFPESEVLVGRELTKRHETIYHFSLARDMNPNTIELKGEFCILIHNSRKKNA